MKKILAYLMVGIAFTGCNSLDLEPISSIADNKYWQTEAQVDAFNVGLHSKFREKCSYSIFLFGEPRADYYFGESTFGSATQGNERMWNNSLNDVNTVVSNFGNLYEVINQANLMINKVEGMSMNESTKKYYLGEVYGIRAFLYFQLLRSYGDVVIWTDFSEGSSLDLGNLARPASSAADVMKLIVDDLQASETAFGDNYGFRNDSQRYFWSKAATMMLKGEVYMWRGKHMGGGNEDYTTAKNALQEVRNQTDKFGLLEDFSEVFSYDNKNNKEIIFAIRNARDEYNMWGDVTYNNNMFPQQNILFGYMDENGNPISSLGDKVKVNGTIRYPVNKDVYTKCFNDNDTRKRSTLQAAYEKKEDGTLSLYGLYPAKFLGTLMNLLVGERISIATFKAQTTRHRIMGILNTDDMQIVFSDTPGVLKPNYKLQESMLNFSESALADADVLLYVTDVIEKPDKNLEFIEKVRKLQVPILLLINKIDLTNQEELVKLVEEWHELIPQAEIIPISATSKFNIDVVMKRIKELLPDSPPYFGKDQWTDKPARFFVTEIIREKILLYYDKEIPYSVEVVVEQFKEDAKSIHINAVIYVERDSQKGIIIGKQGKALKKVATEARKTLEHFFQKSVYLETFVKVDKDWRSSDKELKNFGYQLD